MSQIIGGHTFVPLERNIDDVKLNAITGGATITSELISTQALSTSAVTGDQFLVLKSGGTLARILYDDLATSLGSSSGMTSAITSVRLRSFNAVSNASFEVDQRNCFSSVANIANNGWSQDRWQVGTAGTMKASTQAFQGQTQAVVPGTSFLASQAQLNTQVATVEASLAAGDFWYLLQYIEGPIWRELSNDVTSISILCQASVAPFSFAVALRDPTSAHSLVKLATISTANTWTLITLPNIPKPTVGTFTTTPGNVGYLLSICLACGSTLTAPALNTWQTGNFVGASGMSNLFATSGASFILAFCQHEPGSTCTTLIDKPWQQNYDECLRYFCKSWSYATAVGTASSGCYGTWVTPLGITGSALARGHVPFPKRMAKTPTAVVYDPTATNANNSVFWQSPSASGSTSVGSYGVNEAGIFQMVPTGSAAGVIVLCGNYTGDTGW